MTRLGSCLRCGACCRFAGWFRVEATADLVEWLGKRDSRMQVRELEPADDDGISLIDVLVPHTCEHLTQSGGVYSCALHDAEKPQLCKEGPTPETLEAGCGFTFTEEV
jgi:Fe-S-cluster containining protein